MERKTIIIYLRHDPIA